jgi:FAD/FMN-containing dehydrogenase
MTTQQLHLFNGLYFAAFAVAAFLTRATPRRIAGALAGGAAFGVVAVGIVALGEAMQWWHMAIVWEPYFVGLFYFDFAISSASIYLVTWRIAQRFGWRGLAVVVVFAAIIGPARDSSYMTKFPEWGTYAPGLAPVLAIAATYALMIVVGQSVMRLAAGPARGSPLGRRPWATPTCVSVENFGRNIAFQPAVYLVPSDEDGVLAMVKEHAGRTIRAIGSLHSWSDAAVSDDVLLDLRRLDSVRVVRRGDELWAAVGAGCQIKRLLAELDRQANATLPSLGLITEQTIAGAISTGTHGSGKHSMSHYVDEIRLATFDRQTGEPIIKTISEGEELRAARCSLGCMGVILTVKIRARPQYQIEEHFRGYSELDDVLSAEEHYPLQQFYLIPWSWRYLAQHRRELQAPRSRLAGLYRLYWFLTIDLGLHVAILFLVRWLRSGRVTRFSLRHVLTRFVIRGWRVVDKSQRQLVMEHEMFRHIEIEIFVRRSKLAETLRFVRDVLECLADRHQTPSEETREALAKIQMSEQLDELAGSYVHHYPICVRRVLPDDTLISMASGPDAASYAISFISYARPADRAGFLAFARFLALSAARLFAARPHWGKVCPLDAETIAQLYEGLSRFRAICQETDPSGRFRNRWTAKVLFDADSDPGNGESVSLRGKCP